MAGVDDPRSVRGPARRSEDAPCAGGQDLRVTAVRVTEVDVGRPVGVLALPREPGAVRGPGLAVDRALGAVQRDLPVAHRRRLRLDGEDVDAFERPRPALGNDERGGLGRGCGKWRGRLDHSVLPAPEREDDGEDDRCRHRCPDSERVPDPARTVEVRLCRAQEPLAERGISDDLRRLRGEPLPQQSFHVVHPRPPVVPAPRVRRRLARARARWLFTAPTEQPSAAAIWSSPKSS